MIVTIKLQISIMLWFLNELVLKMSVIDSVMFFRMYPTYVCNLQFADQGKLVTLLFTLGNWTGDLQQCGSSKFLTFVAREYAGALRLAFKWNFRSFEITIACSQYDITACMCCRGRLLRETGK